MWVIFKQKYVNFILFFFYYTPTNVSTIFLYIFSIIHLLMRVLLEHPYQMWQKKCHFATSNAYFIILPHHFTTFHLSDVLSFNSIH